jgi:aminopeptidase N
MPSAVGDRGRTSILDIVSYDLAVDLTHGAERFWSRTEVRFRCRSAGASTYADLQAVSVRRAKLNGADLAVAEGHRDGRLELPRLAAENALVVEAEFAYSSAAKGLHYVTAPADGGACVYSKTSSHGAPRIYCCFDEPSLRAPFTVSVHTPAGWSCLANGRVVSRPPEGDPGIWQFASTAPIPPWLSSFCAGPFSGSHDLIERAGGQPLPVSIQAAHATAVLVPGQILGPLRRSLWYYERALGVPYPYRKCDLVFVPALPILAYSVPGLIIIQDEVVKDGEQASATLRMATVIAHELAHAWIGSLVVMRHREEMWLDEALTTYISRAALEEIVPGTTPWAPSTSAALPDHAYADDAAAVKQLEHLIGRQAVIGGLGTLLRRHAHSSTTKDDLVQCWSQVSGQDLREWAAATLIHTLREET